MKLVRRLFYFLTAFIVVFGLILGTVYGLSRHNDLFVVTTIPVEVVSGSEQNVMKHSPGAPADLQLRISNQLKQFSKQKIWEIQLGKIQASISADEWVKDVHISRILPNELRVTVTPQQPVLILEVNKNSEVTAMMPVTADGRLLSALAPDRLPDVPILRGEGLAEETPQGAELRLKAVQFALRLPRRGPLALNNLSELAWDKQDGFALTLINPRASIKLGDEMIELKVLRVAKVVNYLTTNHLGGRVIDASFSKKVLVRLRKGP